ncbi:Vicilin-like antimicrobial peptides 2-2 [Dendrobium catenatum]|uniref:Vicilin-like antimicrobial peptides 2-2 n=1 Tax=Dendrobium catenatum TaxID=906689 RepID=A0A2I0WLU1_9ASPA|nr:Vicilin-like antimicrobial peptides 2-2 [Dendrobium catenatum]
MQERMKMKRKFWIRSLVFVTFILGTLHFLATGAAGQSQGLLATKENRRSVVYTEAGEITALDVSNGQKDFGSYHMEFFTLDTRSLLLPVLLHADMVFYVHTGRGTISWIDKNKVEVLQVEPGDIYRLEEGTVFYIQSSGDSNREKLRIHAIFSTENPTESFIGGAYSNIADLVRGFDMEVLQMSFGASVEVIEKIKRTEKPPLIIPFEVKNESESHNSDWKGVFEAVLGMRTDDVLNGNVDKKAFNVFKRKPDVENRHGRSITLTQKDVKSLEGSSMGVFMVNLTKGSMIGPHWNPKATEIAIVIEGHGIVQVICPSNPSGFGIEKFTTKKFYVKEGDVFIIPKFYPMTQMSFNNSSFVFVGFSNNGKKNHPQFLTGKWSVIQAMDREVMAASFNVTSKTFEHLLAKQKDEVLLGCEGCAEEVKKKLEEEDEERRRKKEEEEAKRREEEEEARRHEQEVRKREEERKREEDARRKEEKEEKKREEERKAKEAEQRSVEEEEAQRRKEEEETQRREEEEEAQMREKEEEAQRKWKEDEQRARETREKEEEMRIRKREEEVQRERERMKEEEEVGKGEKRKGKHKGDVIRKSNEEKDEAQKKEEEEEDGMRKGEGEIEKGEEREKIKGREM